MTLRTDRVRLVALVKKLDSISMEEFSRHWFEEHSKLFAALPITQANLLKYEQAHTNDKVLEVLQRMGMLTPQWAGVAVYEAESYEKIFAIFKDEEYLKVIIPDQEKFVDREGCQVLPVDLVTILDK